MDEPWCVVTGGRGFAARHLVEMLIRYEVFSVRIADLPPSIKLEPHEGNGLLGEALKSGRAQYVSFDLRDKAQVVKAIEGCEVVFHMAAPDSSINNHQLHYSVNVIGTKNVIDACVELKVKRLIHTSSPSVVFDGVNSIFNGDESLPYPAKHNDSYSATKAEGEALVLKANGSNGLLTCCIRPSSIFGPGDRLLVPSLVTAAREGKSKASMFYHDFTFLPLSADCSFIIGDGNNLYDFTYVENVAHAHVCAERALASAEDVAERAAGQAYFITNMEPIKFWEFVSLILEGLGYERPRIKIPAAVIMPIAHMVELLYKFLGPYGMKVPQLTPSRVRLLSCSRTFSCSKAKERLGYTPLVSVKEGLDKTIASYSHLRAIQKVKRDGPSKASIMLGGGKVADTLLWRNKKQSLMALFVLIAIYHNFIAPGYTMITTASKVLLVGSIFLLIHGCLPEKVLGYQIEKVQESNFQFSESMSRQVAVSVVSSWKCAVSSLKSLSRGNDWNLFFKVVLSLLFLGFLGTVSIHSLFVVALPIAFTAFYMYEKNEEEIDALVTDVRSFGCKMKAGISRKLAKPKKG
ncbi:unnamed protein product [Rhodiola kirilowii]